jgi:lipopolysaccharide export system permease LptF/LptG-like protein
LTVGFLSLAFFLVYYILLVLGEGLSERLLLSPLVAMWLPDVLLGLIGAVWTAAACDVRLWPRKPPAVGAPVPVGASG